MSDITAASSLQNLSDAFAEVVGRTARSIVAVHTARSRSSGFFWRPGLIVTADEALAEDGDIAVVLPSGESAAATVVGRDPTTDVALLRVASASPAGAALDDASASVGALALAIGAQNGTPTAAFGAIAFVGGPWRSLRGGEIDARIELDLDLRRAGEGGLAVDAAGRALGMAVFGPRRRALAIPTKTIERVAAKLETHGRIARGYLGLGLQTTKLDAGAGVGAMVMSVDAGGPGAAAAIRQGDVIVRWNGEPVQGVRALLRALGPESVGRMVDVSLLRGGEAREAVVTIGERPDA